MTKLYLNTAKDWLQINAAGDWLILDAGTSVSYPTSPLWAEFSITSFSPAFVSVTHGLQRQARTRGGHAWQIELRYAAMTRAQFSPLWAFLVKQAGPAGTFTWSPGSTFATQGTGVGAAYVQGAGQTGQSISTDGWGVSQTVAKAGDFFQIEGDTKVYQLIEDVTSDSGGEATMEFFPALRSSPANLADITLSPAFRCALINDTVPTDWNQCVQVPAFDVSLVEVP